MGRNIHRVVPCISPRHRHPHPSVWRCRRWPASRVPSFAPGLPVASLLPLATPQMYSSRSAKPHGKVEACARGLNHFLEWTQRLRQQFWKLKMGSSASGWASSWFGDLFSYHFTIIFPIFPYVFSYPISSLFMFPSISLLCPYGFPIHVHFISLLLSLLFT